MRHLPSTQVLYQYRWFDYEIETLVIAVIFLLGLGVAIVIFSGVLPFEALYDLLGTRAPKEYQLSAAAIGVAFFLGGLGYLGWGLTVGHVYKITLNEPDVVVRHRVGLIGRTTPFALSDAQDATFRKTYRGGRPWHLELKTSDGRTHHLGTIYNARRDRMEPVLTRLRTFIPVQEVDPNPDD